MDIKTLRSKIANGEINTARQGGGPKVGEGTFNCMATEAVFGRGENGNLRGMVKVKVLNGGTDAEVGGEFNLYIQTQNESFMEVDIAIWTGLLTSLGVSEERIFDDADNYTEVVNNIMTIANKLALKEKLKLSIQRKKQSKPDAKGKDRYYNDILGLATEPEAEMEDLTKATKTDAKAPAKEEAQAKRKKDWDDEV